MPTPNKPYWQDRQEKKYLAGEKKIDQYYKDLEKSFEQAKREMQSVINDFYWRFAEENQLSFAGAQLKLSKTEIGDLQAFIDKAYENMGKYNLELNNMSIRARITRYEALQKQIDAQIQQLYAIEYQYKGEELLKEVHSDSYYRTWFNIDQYHGFHQEFAQISAQKVDELIKYPFDGADFSTRLWKQKDHMFQKLNESITTMLIQGRNPKTLAGEMSKTFGTKEYEAYRLLHTEGSFVIEQGSQAAYTEDGVEKYEWLATLDMKTCERCAERDGKTYDVGKGIVGVSMPPLHAFDRCTTVPAYDDKDLSEDTRLARDSAGKSYEVPADMTYNQWHKEYIESHPESLLAEKKIRNLNSDKVQFEEYKEILGKEYIPKSIDEFQNIKYNNSDEYGILKAQTKGMSYYNKAVANEPEISAHVMKVAETVDMNMAGFKYRIKEKDSYLRKIRSKYNPNGNEYEVKDILRYTYTASPDALTDKTLKAIETHQSLDYNTIEIKNYWMNKSDPYNGINTTFKSPSGQKFELQYHTPEGFDLKNGKMHELYEKQRLISDTSSKEYMELTDQMFELSDSLEIPVRIEEVKNR
jgi:SPP1 gp7 family putative phage head morphogenesis protein